VHCSRRDVEVSSAALSTAIHRRVERLRAGDEPTLIARLPAGWAVFGEQQFVAGYSLLLPDPVVPDLHALTSHAQQAFLADMARLGAAVQAATDALRINYAIFGNQEPALHAHVIPRFADEAEELRTTHPWAYDWSRAPALDPMRVVSLRGRIIAALATSDAAG